MRCLESLLELPTATIGRQFAFLRMCPDAPACCTRSVNPDWGQGKRFYSVGEHDHAAVPAVVAALEQRIAEFKRVKPPQSQAPLFIASHSQSRQRDGFIEKLHLLA